MRDIEYRGYVLKHEGNQWRAYLEGIRTNYRGSLEIVKSIIDKTQYTLERQRPSIVDDAPAQDQSLEDWEDQVFKNADHFRIHRYKGRGEQDRAQVSTFKQARALAEEAMAQGYRVLVYAVSRTGRYMCCTNKRWDHYTEMESKQGK